MEDVRPSKTRLILYVVAANLLMFGTFFLGLTGQFIHWLIYDSFGREWQRSLRKLNPTNQVREDEYYAIILGAGFSGLGMGIKLNELGMDKYIIIERHKHLGGTWYANQYPGCACDVPSNLYSFSFEPNPKWSHFFGRQPEIADYLQHCADKYDLRRHIQFDTTLTEMKWIADREVWQVTTKSNDVEKKHYARFIVGGYGPLSNASYPTDIADVDQFQGQMCHTAEWDKSIDFKGKRVAVIGTGASAIQVVPELHKMGVEQMFIFQRTAPWVIPRADREVTDWEKRLFARFPIAQKLVRSFIYWIRESTVLSFAYRLPTRYVNQELVKFNLRREVKDEAFRKKLTPTWDLGCKRVLISNDWYSTIQQPNVKIVSNRIQRLTANSVVTYEGDEYPVDVIVWSTGFLIQKFPIVIYGNKGHSMQEQWAETMQAYRGVTVPNFPNLFLLLGPNTGLGHNSIIVMIEAQIQYITEALLYLQEKNSRTFEIKKNVHDQYNQKLQAGLKKTVWQSGGCHSWYQDAKGNNTTIWPDFTWIYVLLMRHFDAKNYIFH